MLHQYQWEWMNCNLTLKRSTDKNQNQIYQILQSEYVVEFQGEELQTQLNIDISMEKKIHFEKKSGFNWHKSWNIPTIQIKISKRDVNSIKTQLGVNKIYCQMTSGYPLRKNIQFFLQEVLLEGETRKQVGTNGIAKFSNLKFSETSFNHQRNKFSLILIVFAKNEDKTKAILKSFISMPIYVDSRKQARKKNAKSNFISDIILKQQFKEDLQKRHHKKKISKNNTPKSKRIDINLQRFQQNQQQQLSAVKYKIQYSLDGFLRYYSSANIRNKIKHPFYFIYHFYPLLTLYYNKQAAQSPIELLKLLQKSYNLKHESTKSILIVLSFQNEQTQGLRQETKRKFVTLFENWKFFFIQVAVKESLTCNSILKEKRNDKQQEKQQQKRWVLIERQQLYNSYIQYFDDYQRRELQDDISQQSEIIKQNSIIKQKVERYQNFQLHQIITIQEAFHNQKYAQSSKVKLQAKQNQS